jgi:hypothetical protein
MVLHTWGQNLHHHPHVHCVVTGGGLSCNAAGKVDAAPCWRACRPGLPFRLWLRQITYDRLLMLRRRHVEAARRSVQRDVALPNGSSLALAQQLMATGSSPSERRPRRPVVRTAAAHGWSTARWSRPSRHRPSSGRTARSRRRSATRRSMGTPKRCRVRRAPRPSERLANTRGRWCYHGAEEVRGTLKTAGICRTGSVKSNPGTRRRG